MKLNEQNEISRLADNVDGLYTALRDFNERAEKVTAAIEKLHTEVQIEIRALNYDIWRVSREVEDVRAELSSTVRRIDVVSRAIGTTSITTHPHDPL